MISTQDAAALDRLRNLLPGWLDGQGRAVSETALRYAQAMLSDDTLWIDIEPRSIYPTIDGGVEFEFKKGRWSLWVLISARGTIELGGVHYGSSACRLISELQDASVAMAALRTMMADLPGVELHRCP
jgi:hypothetical protein